MDAFLEWLTARAQPDLKWTYALVTLVFRFFAVFIVLWVIQLGMQLSAYVIRRVEGDASAGPTPPNAPTDTAQSSAAGAAGTDAPKARLAEGLDDATVAAIGLALELEGQPEAVRIASERGASAWAMAGRTRQLRFK